MKINVNTNGNQLTISPIGQIDSATSSELQECISQYFTADISHLSLDFSQVDFISSKGLRILVSTYKVLDGRTMEVVEANAAVSEVFRLSGLLGMFCKN